MFWRPGEVILGLYQVKPVSEGGEPRDAHRGGMGLVYRVRHLGWNVDLALKVPRPELFRREAEKVRFQQEAETWVHLGLHPYVVACHYVRRLEQLPCVFSDYVTGGSLAAWLADGRLYRAGPVTALASIMDVAVQVAWGLDHAHRQGVVHQDVKPANILVDPDGRAQVGDFGLAQARASTSEPPLEGAPHQTVVVPGAGAMTYLYASPEQLAREPLTQATDVWSWAASILELFCGGVSWDSGPAAPGALAALRADRGPVPLPGAVAELLERCLQPDPAARPRDMGALAGDLQALYGESVGAPYPRVEPEQVALLADAWSNQALSLLDLGRQQEAERAWAEALRADPQHPHATYNQGLHHHRTGRLSIDELVRRMEAVRDSHPDAWVDEYLLGMLHLEGGDAKLARTMLTAAKLVAPDDYEITAALGDLAALTSSGRRVAARWSYARPSTADTLTSAAQAVAGARSRALELVSRGQFPEAGAVLAEARRIPGWRRHPELLDAWRTLGRHGSRRGLADAWSAGVLEGHTGGIAAVAVTRDGRRALTGGAEDGDVRLWDLSTGACLHVLDAGRRVAAVAMASDGTVGLSGGGDPAPSVWDLLDGARLRSLTGHAAPVTAVAATPDGRLGLSGSVDGTLRLWDLASGACLRLVQGDRLGVNAVALTADGHRVLSAGRTLQVADLAGGAAPRVLAEQAGSPPSAVALTPDGHLGVSGHLDGSLWVWNLETGNPLLDLRGQGGPLRSVAVTPDGRHLASDGRGAAVVVLWDRAAGVSLRSFTGHLGPVSSVAITPDAHLIVSAGEDGTLRLWALDWDYELVEAADWYVGAQSYVVEFLRAHAPSPSGDLGAAAWNERDFAGLLQQLQDLGYGWLRPEGVRWQLDRLQQWARRS
jgi:WD40 repeat protein